MRLNYFWLLLLCCISGLSIAQPGLLDDELLLTGATIIDAPVDSSRVGMDVLIRDGSIVAIDRDLNVDSEVRRINAEGLYLMPGLWDMHAHARHPVAPGVLFPQFLANGVTGIREMNADCENPSPGGTCVAEMHAWREQIAAGEMPGPRLLALSSYPFNPPWDYEVTESEIQALVAEVDRRGVDLIKTYFRLSPQAFRWLTEAASQHGLPVAGHLPLQMTALEASNAGLRSLEHARDFLFDCFPGSAAFRQSARSQNPSLEVMQQMVEAYDPVLCNVTFEAFIANDTWYVPTHVTRRMDAFADDPQFRDDPRKRYIPAAAWESWQNDADRMVEIAPSPEGRRIVREFYTRGLEITGQAYRAGVRVLAGTDSGDTYSFFGSGMHDELGELVKAGLTPAQALTAATYDAAEFLGLSQIHGEVSVGMTADLILLREDPLSDISNISSIEAVIFGGRFYSRTELDNILRDVEQAIAGM